MNTANDAALQVELRLPASMSCLAPLTAFAREYAKGMGFGERDVNRLLLAIEESVVNVIKHGYANDEQAYFDMRLIPSPAGLTVVIHEKGLPFDPDRVNVYSPLELAGKEPQGLGMYLIDKVMDKVEYRNLGRQGKEIRLTKYLQSRMLPADTENLPAAADIPLKASYSDTSIKIRPLVSDDALEVSRCAYMTYGYSYEDFIYYPERIIEANQRGLLYSIVAVAEDSGMIIGHAALKFKTPGDSVAEIGAAFVRPEFRGRGTLGLLLEYAINHARQTGLDGVYVQAVTNHTASQRKAEKSSFVSCGIMLGLLPGDVEFKKLTGCVKQKISALVSFKVLGDYPPVKIYPPARHSRQIDKLYRYLGINATCLVASPAEMQYPADDILIHTSHDAVLNSAHIEVLHYGHRQHVLREVQSYLRKFCVDKADAIFLHLALSHPQTAILAEDFEKMGFFFSGILPGGRSGKETLILQYLNNLVLDHGQILLFSNDARDILSYIQKNSPSQ